MQRVSKIKIDEGWHSEIYLTNKGTIIKKFKRGLRKNFEKEIYFLEKLKGYNFVPKLISFDEEKLEIEMEYINCKKLKDFLKEENDKEKIKKILIKIMEICYILDKLGIEKEEMHRPENHIFICEDRIVLIDWERAKEKENPSNLTQFLHYLVNNKNLIKKGIKIDKKILELAKEYKKSYSKEVFLKIINMIL